MFGDLFTLLGIMGVMLAMNWMLALVTFSVIPFFFLVTNWFRRGRARVLPGDAQVGGPHQRLPAGEPHRHGGGAALPARGAERARPSRPINRQHADANIAPIFYYAVFYPAIDDPGRRGHRAHPALRRRHACSWGRSRMGALVAFVQYSERFWRPISDLSEKFNILQPAMASSERIFLLLDTEPRVVASPAPPGGSPAVRGRVGFEHVWFSFALPATARSWVAARHRLHGGARDGASPSWARRGRARPRSSACSTRFYDVQKGRVTLDGVDIRDLDPAAAPLVARPRAPGRPPLLGHDRLQHPPGLGHLRRAHPRRPPGR